MTNYVPSQHQHFSSHMMSVMTAEAVQAQVTKRYMAAQSMKRSWNMHWLMTCSSVTCISRNVTVFSMHTGQVIRTVFFQKSLCKLITDVMVIARKAVALHHQLVRDMLIDTLSQIKPQFTPLPVQKVTRAQLSVSKVSLSGITREMGMLRRQLSRPQW